MESDESFCVLFRAGLFLCTSGLVSYYGSEHRIRLCGGRDCRYLALPTRYKRGRYKRGRLMGMCVMGTGSKITP